jgi:aryl-alcohol dehydrogenase-like predicted oxidoreductase
VVVELAREWNVTPASLAFSFALSHPRLASVLFGATTPEQVRENVAALEVFHSLDDDQRRRLDDLATLTT